MIDLRRNELVVELDQALAPLLTDRATIDIGALGLLLGIEAGDHYLTVADPVPGSELQGRSVEIPLQVEGPATRLRIPRRGEGWEISFPSGNQCWRHGDDGQIVCSVVGGG